MNACDYLNRFPKLIGRALELFSQFLTLESRGTRTTKILRCLAPHYLADDTYGVTLTARKLSREDD